LIEILFPSPYSYRCLLCDLCKGDSCFRIHVDLDVSWVFMYLVCVLIAKGDGRISTVHLLQLSGLPCGLGIIQTIHSMFILVLSYRNYQVESSQVYPPLPVLHPILHIVQSPPRPTSLLDHPIPQLLNHRRFPLYPTLLIHQSRRPTGFPRNHQILKVGKYRTNRRSR
jgi:hypothetical protein